MTTTTSATTSTGQYDDSAANGDRIATQAPTDANRDLFTKLLVAQIRNQDPLSPQDPTAYVNQLSQLSQTEALQNLAQLTSGSANVLASLQTLALGAQVGSQVTVVTDTLKLEGGTVSGAVDLNGISGGTRLVLTGSDGRETTIDLGAHGAGRQEFTIDPDALGLAPGTYKIEARPDDGSAPAIEITARMNSVRVTSTGVVLQVANLGDVDPSYVTGFNGKTGT
jgi:flagellar basal-body rod modification protein FlgD